jgi:hypothetical protein
VFRPTEYYIVYDFDTMEEIISKDDEQNTYIDIEDNNEFIEGGVCIQRV